jgi:hypothetical protein
MVMLALLLAPLPGISQEKTTEAGWYRYGQMIPDPKGPTPRLPNGKPDLTGLWATTRRADITNPKVQEGHVAELPYTAWGKRQWDNYDVVKNGDYAGNCMPFGWSRTVHGPHPTMFIQNNDYLVVLSEQNTLFHIVYTDGRPHDTDLPQTWFGDSVGHWEGDTLVVVTKNMNGYIKLDTIGHPISSQATFTQTFRRPNFGTIEHTFTIDDPKTYTKPVVIRNTWPLEPFDTKILEYVCMENNLQNLIEGSITPWFPPTGEDAP